jgi:hypothetical protein
LAPDFAWVVHCKYVTNSASDQIVL